ncbi:chemotaxis protein CheX [Desulfopila sp. IMCC35006]|uniref:chemotaxis protein CheX n=1 Tax=Desulfopila sp. IMCC35006 TaxID=2569542 RepID=UPI0010AC8ECB|nr:chemotaxis protein CheX [Desulfopila sp. IMCC35006]TKB25786.1 chemotaxis protein CheX [Desulfopila sp. IMCC35006]
MNQQKRIDKVLDAVETRIQAEVGALLGADFSLGGGERKLVSKEEAFDSLQGKQICAQMDITGEVTGKSCLLIGIKDAILLGGTLIMLPAAELKEVIGREEYSDEIEDSYGEIANIIAGSFTKDFEELYPKSCRFVRKEQEILLPVKVDIDADTPVANGTYYQFVSSMVLDGHQMGNLVLLMPAATFELQDERNKEQPSKETVVARSESKPVAGEDSRQDTLTETAVAKKPPAVAKFDVVKHQKKINRLLAECQARIEKEVAILLGTDITLSNLENRILKKEEFFEDHVSGRQVLADMEVAGEGEVKSYLAMSVKDAIHLGGKLIMLPPAELESVVSAQDFSVDARDAYGEIANIISGVYTAVFEEQYTEKLRFIRKELRDIEPAKVDVASTEPIPDTTYYVSSVSIAVDKKQLGRVHMLFPATLLRLADEQEETAVPEKEQHRSAEKESLPPAEQTAGRTAAVSTAGGNSAARPSQAEAKKQQKIIDKILAACRDRMAEEVSALLGTEVTLSNLENLIVGKEEFFFDEVTGKQVIANMDVTGELEGKSYLSIGLRDAIRIGGTLIMLPSSELDSVAAAEDFNEDTQDAFGEIANIIAGVYTAGFEEMYPRKVRFIKTGLQQVAPMKVDIADAEPFPDQDYYLSRMDLALGTHGLGKIHLLFPADLLQLDGLRGGSDGADNEAGVSTSAAVGGGGPASGQEPGRAAGGDSSGLLDILVVGDDDAEARKIAAVLGESGYAIKILSFKDNLHGFIPGKLKAIYLVMQEVNEQAFGVAIKISSACSVPLIAAGPGWTRTKVIKAVKYGVRDILLTPASQEDIRENINSNLLEMAA